MRGKQWRIQDFPAVGAPTLQGTPTYDFAKFSQKLHGIEKIWTWGRPSRQWQIYNFARISEIPQKIKNILVLLYSHKVIQYTT